MTEMMQRFLGAADALRRRMDLHASDGVDAMVMGDYDEARAALTPPKDDYRERERAEWTRQYLEDHETMERVRARLDEHSRKRWAAEKRDHE